MVSEFQHYLLLHNCPGLRTLWFAGGWEGSRRFDFVYTFDVLWPLTVRSMRFQVIPSASVKAPVNGSAPIRSHRVLGDVELNKLVPVPSTGSSTPSESSARRASQ